METAELLVELGVEEMPAPVVAPAARQFGAALEAVLHENRLPVGNAEFWSTPRRLIVALENVPARQDDLVETITGPPKKISFDSDGKPTRAAESFAAKHGIRLTQVRVLATPKGEYISAVRTLRGAPTMRLLPGMIPEAIKRIQFPKAMCWTEDRFRFIRPIRWVVALYAGRIVRFQVADVRSSRFTSGHRFLGERRIQVSSGNDLLEKLKASGVIVESLERRRRITEGIDRECRACGGTLVEDPGLLDLVVDLNECPTVIRGAFDHEFLELPREILITVMREHQKYFSMTADDGSLIPEFLAVINLDRDATGDIRKGHERVLRARLADAAFFWKTDRAKRLADQTDSLRHVLFQEQLGSYADKTERVRALLPELARDAQAEDLTAPLLTAAGIFKCDLVTEMVKELPDLQGVVGGLYAREEGYEESVWRAIYEHYQPRTTSSPPPSTRTGALLALADRLDTLCGCFSAGIIPSGSKDPFALRRQGNGILKIILGHRLPLGLGRLVRLSLEVHQKEDPALEAELRSFLAGRLRHLLEESGMSYDCINAGLAVGCDDAVDALERIRALQNMREEPDFLALASSFKRVKNILAQAGGGLPEPDPAALREPAEEALWSLFQETRPVVSAAEGKHEYGSALRAMARMRPAVDRFFDEVLVMAREDDVRENRLALLRQLEGLFMSVADISEIVVDRGP